MNHIEEQRLVMSRIAPAAAFIGARLNHPSTTLDGGAPMVSTIRVDQHKEKFHRVRVYCHLADEGMVRSRWQWAQQQWWNRIENKPFVMTQLTELDACASEPSAEFRARCMRRDAAHYRSTYMLMVDLLPDMRDLIVDCADYRDLLHDDLESFKDMWRRSVDSQRDAYPEYLLRRFEQPDEGSLMDFMRSVYDPTGLDRVNMRD